MPLSARFILITMISICLSLNAYSAENGPIRFPTTATQTENVALDHQIPEHRLSLLSGETISLHKLCINNKAIVIAVYDVDCPLALRQAPALKRLENSFQNKSVTFLHVNMNSDEDVERIRSSFSKRGLSGIPIHDKTLTLARSLNAKSTTELFIIDSTCTLRFHGGINDQYGIGFSKEKANQHFAENALHEILANQLVSVKQSTAPGCLLDIPAISNADTKINKASNEITYYKHISRIMQNNCVICHRPGASGPFRLDSYAAVKRKAKTIGFVVDEGIMPPWFVSDKHGGPWKNARKLTANDKHLLQTWIDQQMPAGDPADAPLAINWPQGWQIGKPDYSISYPNKIEIPAEGVVNYKYAYVKTNLKEDKWVSAVEIHSQAKAQLHHVLTFQEDPRRDGETDEELNQRREGGTRTNFSAAVPGRFHVIYPAQSAKLLKAGAWIKFQLHYTTNGTAASDKLSVGFRFADKQTKHQLHTRSAFTTAISIPPFAKQVQHSASYSFEQDVFITSLNPHAHLRSQAFRYELTDPDGNTKILLDIPHYDFNWQTDYEYQTPLFVAKDSVITCHCWYDNSADNPGNPDPSVEVTFGQQTWDEMLIGYFDCYTADGSPMTDYVGRKEQ